MNTLLTRISEWILAAVIIALPWQTRAILIKGFLNHDAWEYGTISVYGLDILLLLFFFFGCATLYAKYNEEKQKHVVELTWPLRIALLLLVIIFFSSLFAVNNLNALFWMLKAAEGVALALLISQLHLRRAVIATSFVISGVVQAALALWQFSTQYVVANKWLGMSSQDPLTLGVQVVETAGVRILRAYGSLPHPNILGGFLAITILVTLVTYFRTQRWPHRILLAATLAIQSIGLWVSFSRQAWLALALTLAFLALYLLFSMRDFPRKAVLGLAYIALPFIIFTAVMPELVATRVTASERLETLSLNERATYSQQANALIADHWAFGVGVGNYTATLHAQDEEEGTRKPGFAYQPVHNIYQLVWAELGIFGIITLLLLLASLVVEHWKRDRLPWLLPLLALMVIGFFDHYLWSLHVGIILFWLILGFALTVKPQKQPLFGGKTPAASLHNR